MKKSVKSVRSQQQRSNEPRRLMKRQSLNSVKEQIALQPKLIVGLRPSIANVQGNNPKDRYGLAKTPFSLIPSSAMVFMAMGLKHGAQKYGPFNWRVEPVQGRVYLEAALRHLLLLLDGEDFDRDTGYHHGCFVMATMAIFMDSLVGGRQIDNRALPGRTGDLVAFFNDMPGQTRSKQELIEGFKALIPGHLLGTPLAPMGTTTKSRRNKRSSTLTGRTPSMNPSQTQGPKKG